MNYRRSVHHTHGNQVIIQPEGCNSREAAEKLVGKSVTWNTGKRGIKGKITKAHGKQGAVLARFETGMPGQCLGQEVQINP